MDKSTFAGRKAISDYEIERHRLNPEHIRQLHYRDLFTMMLQRMAEEDVSPSDYIFRVSERRDKDKHIGWQTLYEINAVAIEDARRLLGVKM